MTPDVKPGVAGLTRAGEGVEGEGGGLLGVLAGVRWVRAVGRVRGEVWEVVGVVRSLAVAVCLVVVVLVVVLVVGPPASSTAAAAAVDPRAGGVLVGAHGVALLARLTGHPHQICPKTQQTNASINPFPLGDEHVTDRSNYPLIKYQRSFGLQQKNSSLK